jgi:DNA polymerase elongation subunit (family B)
MDNSQERRKQLRAQLLRLESEIIQLENQQTAIKILLNSLYGALG